MTLFEQFQTIYSALDEKLQHDLIGISHLIVI